MKIFNWVHRRFHQAALKDGLAKNVKKAQSITNDADKQALLKQVALVDVLDGWKDGILTIGTLGFDPLKPFTQQNEYFILETEEDEDEQVEDEGEQELDLVDGDEEDTAEDEVNPLILTTLERRFEDIGSSFDANHVQSDGITFADLSRTKTNSCDPETDQRKKRGDRITLAELFLADSDMKKKPDFREVEPHSGKKPAFRNKNSLSFAKKMMPHVGEDSRLIKKLHKLMKRMLKRKIHPEFEGKGSETDNQTKPAGDVDGHTSRGEKGSESASLLQAPAPGPTLRILSSG